MSDVGFGSVAVVGLGLMGGSLARALRALPRAPEVVGYSPEPAEREAALAAGAVDAVGRTADEVAGAAELVVYAAPLAATLDLLGRQKAVWRADAVVTDLASLKAPVLRRVREAGAAERFVGSHPMAGGERSGFGAARDDLYRGAAVWLARGTGSGEAKARVERFWSGLGARPAWIDAEEHDRRMALVSHVPQLLANALAAVLGGEGLGRADLGPGGREMTRLAGSAPAVWRDLLDEAGPDLADALRRVADEVTGLAGLVRSGDVDAVTDLMERTRRWKEASEVVEEREESGVRDEAPDREDVGP